MNMHKRLYGQTDEVSVIAFGGIVIKEKPQDEATRIVRRALDRGVNYFDVGPQYGDPEILLGPALDGVPRDDYFLACKSYQRDAKRCRQEMERSLKRLHTDHFDLFQHHNCATPEQVDETLGPGGALEALVKARDEGLTRYLGFSTHSEKAGCRLLDAFDYDSALFPINWVCILKDTFGRKLLAKCKEKGATALSIKAMARTNWATDDHPDYPFTWYQPETDPELSALTVRFALDQGATAVVPPGHEGLFFHAVDVADDYRPLTEDELARLCAASESVEPLFPRS
jgi:aryl-alcohol dehydrogenase-like predicted oxidoreductase